MTTPLKITQGSNFFQPTAISGCQIWLDAADSNSVTLSGSSISKWNDKSGCNNHIYQAVGSNQPTYQSNYTNGLNVVFFTPSQWVQGSTNIFTTYTRFLVYSNSVVTVGAAVIDGPGYLQNGGGATYQDFVGYNNTLTFQTGGVFRMGEAYLPTGGGSSAAMWVNGTLQTLAFQIPSGTYSFNYMAVGRRSDGIYFTGAVAEIVVYNRQLTTNEMYMMEGYLAWKWGLQTFLPANHPYRNKRVASNGPYSTVPYVPFTYNNPVFLPTQVSGCQMWLDGADSNSMVFTSSGSGTAGTATLNQYVTLNYQTVTVNGTLAGLSSFTGGTSFMGGGWISGGGAPTAATFARSASTDIWYSYFSDPTYNKVVKLQFSYTGGVLSVKVLSAGYSTNLSGVSSSNSGSTNDTNYAGYTSAPVATTSTADGYGVESFTMNFTGATISVSQWKDKSGNGNNATGGVSPTYVTSGINNLGVVNFNGSSQYLNSQDLYSNRSFVIFTIIRRQTSISAGRTVIGSITPNTNIALHLVWRTNTNIAFAFYSNDLEYYSFPNYTGDPNTEPAYLMTYYYTPGTRQIYVNGLLAAADTNSTNLGTNTIVIGQAFGGAFWYGYIGEILTYNAVLTTPQRQQVEGYLAWKWGLTASLPNGHPYKTPPIAPFSYSLVKKTVSNKWSLSVVSGLSVWYDGSDPNGNGSLPANGASVSTWTDKSGNGKNATAGVAPSFSASSLNRLGTIRFNGSNGTAYYLDTPAFDFGTSQRTAFFVIQNTGPASGSGSVPHWFWPNAGNATNSLSIVGWISTNIQGTAPMISISATKNSYLIVSYRFGSISAFEELFLNGTLAGTATKTIGGSSYANATSGYRLGSINPTQSTYEFDGNMAEILLYNQAVSNTQRQNIEGYLAWKWGLVGSLPSNHPCKLSPPPPP